MLKLRRIELVGFKSFHDRSEIRVGDAGVTAVVGPNGCGKSNISDAVAWVLGEQKARLLRGDRMEDVIFSGTGKRAPLGMAEVSMSLIDDSPPHANGNGSNGNGNGGPPPGPVELTVQRRLFRSGESQYLINGRPCRLRDVQDIFLGTGLGPNSYAIIEQGRIGQILSARPTDRRTIVEEAAGITRFKAKRKLAESRLQAAEKNLARVNDILSEVERQRNSLKRQASKARRYREVRQRLREVLARVFSTRAESLITGQEAVTREMDLMSGEGHTLDEQIAELDAKVHEARAELEARERRLEEAREQRMQAELDLEKAQQSIERQRDRARSLETREVELTSDVERIGRDLASRSEAIEAAKSRLSEVESRRQDLSDEIGRGEEQIRARARQRKDEEEALEAARSRRLDIGGREAELGNEIGGKLDLLERVRRHVERADSERAEALLGSESVGERTRAAGSERDQVEARIAGIRQDLVDADRELTGAREANEVASEAVRTARSDEDAVRHRLETIRELSQERAYGTEALQDFFNDVRDEAWAPAGIVADFIDVEPEYEAAVEDLLHMELQYIVVQDLDQTIRAVGRARETNRGRLDFFVLDEGPDGHASPDPIAGARPVGEVVRFDARLRSFSSVLNRAYLVEDFQAAWNLSERHSGMTFVAGTGEVVRDRVVSWGERSGRGPLSLKREMRELDRKVEQARRRVVELERESVVCQSRADELAEARKRLEAGLRNAETEVLGLDHLMGTLQAERERAVQRLRVAEGELSRLGEEAGELEAGVARARSEVAEIRQNREAIDLELKERAEASARLTEEGERDVARVAESRSQLAVLDERREAGHREIEALGSQIGELVERGNWARTQIESVISDRLESLGVIRDNQEKRDALALESTRLQTQIQEDFGKLDVARQELHSAEAGWDETRKALDGWKDRRNSAEIRRTEIESDLRHLVSACHTELGDTIESVCLDTFETLSPEELENHEAEHRSLRQRLESMGNVNMMAVEEYEEAEQRFGFLSTQRQDLLDSIRDTTQAIREIDTVCSRQFSEAFEQINARFREAFIDLFGGGHGELRLIEEADDSDAGIEIVAQPPGKKLQNVLLLSGGEKALTALSLVLALFRFRPSPFCVLDEVDAPLDDANVDRFANMIRLMSEETQFIVITHSKRTMETANQLYGVTMEEPGVSKVVSVRLN